ncbi:MAG: TetR/AcrR family transcriptional regulator [Sedimentibacter sp.]
MIKIDRASIQKENILRNSFILFKKNGYNKTTTREIALASGINKGLLHYYYKQKEDIIFEMYNNLLSGLFDFVDFKYKDKVSGLTYYAVLNILFFRTISSRSYFLDTLSEIMLYRNLTRIKIEKSVESSYKIIKDYNIPITEYQLFLAITVAVGAEAELLLSIKDGKLKMTYDKLATTINKLLFTMLKIGEREIKSINEESKVIADNIDINDILDYLKNKYAWLKDEIVL